MPGPERAFLRLSFMAVGTLLALSACTIEVPVQPGAATAPSPTATSSQEVPGPSATGPALPPLTRAQIVGEDMTLDRGSYIEQGEGVAFADGMTRSEGWTLRTMMVNGESVYENAAGCTTSLRYTGLQTPLVVDGDDRASTEALFAFLDPSILPEYLEPTSWLWGENPAESSAVIEFLTYRQPATDAAPASVMSLRLFNQLRTALAVSIACPSDDLLDGALQDVRSRISVVPPRD